MSDSYYPKHSVKVPPDSEFCPHLARAEKAEAEVERLNRVVAEVDRRRELTADDWDRMRLRKDAAEAALSAEREAHEATKAQAEKTETAYLAECDRLRGLYDAERSAAERAREQRDFEREAHAKTREALRQLVGHVEIAAVAPEAIGKALVYALKGPELTAARAALRPTEPPASPPEGVTRVPISPPPGFRRGDKP